MENKTIRLVLRQVDAKEYALYRSSDGRRECLPFDCATDAVKWAFSTKLNGVDYAIDRMEFLDGDGNTYVI